MRYLRFDSGLKVKSYELMYCVPAKLIASTVFPGNMEEEASTATIASREFAAIVLSLAFRQGPINSSNLHKSRTNSRIELTTFLVCLQRNLYVDN